MSIKDYYTETIKIKTITDPGQFSTTVATESCSTASAAMNLVSGVENFAGGRNDVFADYKAFMSSTVSVNEQNRVVYSGDTYGVRAVKDTLNRGHHKIVFLKKDVR